MVSERIIVLKSKRKSGRLYFAVWFFEKIAEIQTSDIFLSAIFRQEC